MAFYLPSANTYGVLELSFHAAEGGDTSVCCCHLVSARCQPGKGSNIQYNESSTLLVVIKRFIDFLWT